MASLRQLITVSVLLGFGAASLVNALSTVSATRTCEIYFQKKANKNSPDPRCIEVCQTGCTNGTCDSRGACVCKPGFGNVLNAHYQCEPDCPANGHPENDDFCRRKCEDGCEYGACDDQGACHCQQECNEECINGKCIAPNECSCNEGYERENEKCIPKCNEDCINGKCIAPNKCSCNEGYERENEKCIPKCNEDCINGKCIAPNKCSCNEGYEREKEKCIPKCNEDCINGKCIAPNKCSCSEGFELKDEECVPKCNEDCINGKCIAPNKCSCSEGFELKDEECAPKCNEDCINGKCIAPNKCSCNEGFEMKDEECIPKFTPPCTNGNCTSPHRCVCIDGFALDGDRGCIYRGGMLSGVMANPTLRAAAIGGGVLALIVVLGAIVALALMARRSRRTRDSMGLGLSVYHPEVGGTRNPINLGMDYDDTLQHQPDLAPDSLSEPIIFSQLIENRNGFPSRLSTFK